MVDHTKENSEVYLTPNQAAQLLSVSTATFKKFIYQGAIKTFRTPGGHYRIRKSDLLSITSAKLPQVSAEPSANIDNDSLFQIASGFLQILEKRQKFCQGHSLSVSNLSILIGQRLHYLPERLHNLALAALLHDIGKSIISENILNKTQSLTSQEYSLIRAHPVMGEQILSGMPYFKRVLPIISQHHERFDGAGYPKGLRSDQILEEARIITVVDAFDVMTSLSSYKASLSVKQALAEIKKNAVTQFDPAIVEVFLQIYN